MIKPKRICIDASTVCQLKCPSCPTANGEIGKRLGMGFLRFKDFKEILEKNPQIYSVELSNWGEIFLNKELGRIIKYAYMHNIALSAANGANINNATDDILEAMVKYKFRKIKCSIDGASQKTYSIYRVNGDFDRVLKNIRTINSFKKQYNSFLPILEWQFVPFGHNEHEIEKARKMAVELNMDFKIKLSWDDLFTKPFSPIKNAELIRRISGLSVASREEFRKRYEKEYISNICLNLWIKPQVNYDGRLLGCCVNFWDDYGNVFKDGLNECINSEKANYAREMLMGKKEEIPGIPCSQCKFYKWKKEDKNWVTNKDIKEIYKGSKKFVMLENKLFNYRLINKLAELSLKVFLERIKPVMR